MQSSMSNKNMNYTWGKKKRKKNGEKPHKLKRVYKPTFRSKIFEQND